MSATADKISSEEFRGDLEELVRLAADVMIAEELLEAFAEQMEADAKWWRIEGIGPGGFTPVNASVMGALDDCQNRHDCDAFYGADKATSVCDALAVLDFAIGRDHLGNNGGGNA